MPMQDPLRMVCMEVWGGNQAMDSGVVMAGLDAWVYCRPYQDSQGGGDVYYVSSCATGRINRLLVADVSGHGDAVAETARELRTLMRKYVNYIDQSAFVRGMNRQFIELSQDGCFATAVVTTFFAPTNDLSLCNAGHPPPLIYRAKTRRWDFLEESPQAESQSAANIPLGIDDIDDYQQFDVRLHLGDMVLCYTDSLIESYAANGEMLGTAGLLQIVRTIDVTDAAAVVRALLKQIASLREGNLANDDVTVLLFRPNGLAPRGRWIDRYVNAPRKLMAALFSSLRPGGPPMPWPEFTFANFGGAVLSPLNRFWKRKSDASKGQS